jgi:hypothetical protein
LAISSGDKPVDLIIKSKEEEEEFSQRTQRSNIGTAKRCLFNFMLKNNMEYPYNIEASINESHYIDRSENAKVDKEGYIIPLELTNEQNQIMADFFEMLKLMYKNEYFRELKDQAGIIAFSITNINLYKDPGDFEFIGVWIKYYSDKKLGDMSTYDEKNDFWEVYNIAAYSIDEYIFLGWVF